MPGPMSTFEPGFDPVVRLEFPERIHRTTVIEIGRREGRVRVESGDDWAWEFDAAGRLIVAQEDSLSLHATFDGRIWGHRIVGAGPGRRLMDAQGPEDSCNNPGTCHDYKCAANQAGETDKHDLLCFRHGDNGFLLCTGQRWNFHQTEVKGIDIFLSRGNGNQGLG